MGFDEINLLSKDSESTFNIEDFQKQYDDLMKQFDTSAVDDFADSISNLTKTYSALAIVMGAVSLAFNATYGIMKLINYTQEKSTALTAANIAAKKGEEVQSKKNIFTIWKENMAQKGLNKTKMITIALGSAIAAGAIAAGVLAIAGAFSSQQDSITKSAEGNYFPSASATIIGEKYPEVAIPLGNSPQYADMQETIANRTAEKLSEMNGFNGTVNVYIGNEQIRDFAVQAVNDDLRVNYGTNLGKLARS